MSAHPVLSTEVRDAVADGRPVVALESTIISHGLPRPRNYAAAVEFEQILRDMDVVPATIAVIDGVPRVGLDEEQVHRIAEDTQVVKLSVRDLPLAVAAGTTGATTVAATALLAQLGGVHVFSTGGLGGVHKHASETFDESADLGAVSRIPITIVSAGAKSILDVGLTLERLESLSVTVAGYRTTDYPGFYISDSGFDIDWKVDDADEIARAMRAQHDLGLTGAILIANPLTEDKQLDPELHDRVLADALAAAEQSGIAGKDVTPFLLDFFQRTTEGKSLEVNLDIARGNIRLGGEIATAFAALPR